MDMDENERLSLTRRAAPYSLAVVPATGPQSFTDPANEVAIQRQWQRICERHGAAILGIRDVPTTSVRAQLDGVLWELGPLGNGERAVPAEVFNRVRALEAAGVPLGYWLWGEELPQLPNLRPFPEPTPATAARDLPARQRDPLLIGVIPTAPGRGLWVLLGRWFH